MRTLSDTIVRLAAGRAAAPMTHAAVPGRLTDLPGFGSNPGALAARTYVPADLAAGAALVVVLHGCTQDAAGYDHGSGWSGLAERHGFALLLPEQQRANNPNLCFNWFSPEDSRRGSGEALSIRQMIGAMVDAYDIDPARIYVTGLSAGGAMASVMLATYPELFASGAIIAGLPFGCATSIPQAFDRMRGHGGPSEADLAALVRAASGHNGPWPTISVWHGSGDATVAPSNAEAIIGQWRGLHGVAREPTQREVVDGYPRRVWCDAAGRPVIEDYSITGMGHGTPLDTMGEDGCGASGAYMLEVSISSTRRIAAFWGLCDAVPVDRSVHDEPVAAARPSASKPAPAAAVSPGIGRIIDDALRAAGLVR